MTLYDTLNLADFVFCGILPNQEIAGFNVFLYTENVTNGIKRNILLKHFVETRLHFFSTVTVNLLILLNKITLFPLWKKFYKMSKKHYLEKITIVYVQMNFFNEF